MAAIYLRHPIHGTKVAISDLEAENDIHNGWAYFDPMARPSAEVQEAELETTNNLPRRRGRRPKESTE